MLALTTSHASSGFGSGVLTTEDNHEAPAIPCANEGEFSADISYMYTVILKSQAQ